MNNGTKVKRDENQKNPITFSDIKTNGRCPNNDCVNVMNFDEAECLMNANESDEEIKNNQSQPHIPLSLACDIGDIKNVIKLLSKKSKQSFIMNLAFFIFYLCVVIASIVVYIIYQKSCPSIHSFGESSIGFTCYLLCFALAATIAAQISYSHCTKILRHQRKTKTKNKDKQALNIAPGDIGSETDGIGSETDARIEFIDYMLDKLKSNVTKTFINVLKIGQFMKKHKLNNILLENVIKENPKPKTNQSEKEMEAAVYSSRRYMMKTSCRDYSTNNRTGLDTNFHIFYFSVHALPVLTTMFWILAGVNAMKNSENESKVCNVPLIYYWTVAIGISIMSIAQLIPMFIKLFTRI